MRITLQVNGITKPYSKRLFDLLSKHFEILNFDFKCVFDELHQSNLRYFVGDYCIKDYRLNFDIKMITFFLNNVLKSNHLECSWLIYDGDYNLLKKRVVESNKRLIQVMINE